MRIFPLGIALIVMPALAAAQQVPVPPPSCLKLNDAFASTLRRSEDLARRGETVEGLTAKIAELSANLRPGVNLTASRTWEDKGTPSVQSPRGQAAIEIRQSLFSGMKDVLSVKAARSQKESAVLDLARARQLLYRDVASAYLDLLSIGHELDIRLAQIDISRERLKELETREKIGRSRASELLAARSQLAQDEAQIQNAIGLRKLYLRTLGFLTGAEETGPACEPPLPEDKGLAPYLASAAQRPDVQARHRDLASYEFSVDAEKGLRWPSLDLGGDYYLKRPRTQEKIDWNIGLEVRLPLYSGGAINAGIRAAEALSRSARQTLSLVVRQAELDIKTAYDGLQTALSVAVSLEKALELAQANAEAQMADYKLGLVTNLDVLTSLKTVQETALALDNARIDAVWAQTRLETAAGQDTLEIKQ
ncbi:MAG: hypothetical protein A2270_04400 [Elusimicrobia bacterium RIFOXYA12_FULL_51_18]|nr:MAG: hypothetical protein A2270_04400 [Elusimicrobia bacterium RIFOXYA12_FULL_51_18]OGS30045.1 MAG: hypothetical protein A2218_12925 [Elusimicrobia bacterium RIFOXYA2_FULL_53_38]